ncbi:MAG: selenide, water dikinase SelD [Sphaerochaetaceae bacterium]
MSDKVKLTSMVKTSGCAAKLPPGTLDEVLSSLPLMKSDKLISGFEGNEDALVYDLGDNRVMVATVDFFPPMVDDPYTFGTVAAANALSDAFAMGCKPAVALNLMCFPSCLDTSVMREILLGGQDKVGQADAVIAGGHTISDATPKYGLCVIGFGEKDKIWSNRGAKEGDILILTKKIGTGVAMTALKGEMCDKITEEQATKSMQKLNSDAYENAKDLDVHAATDVTGFSLLGHLYEMSGNGDITMVVESGKVQFFDGVEELARLGLIPSGLYHNRDYIQDKVKFEDGIVLARQDLLFDPQTSGGLLFALSKDDAETYIARMKGDAFVVGHLESRGESPIVVTK